MNLKFVGVDFELTDAIKSYTTEKLEKLNKYLGDEFNAVATFKIEKNEHIAEIRLSSNLGHFKATTASSNLYASIDKNMDILEGQIRKTKTKNDKQNMTETIRVSSIEDIEEDFDDVEGEVIKTIYYDIKPLMVDDALLLLKDDSRNKFLTFINVETNKVNVIYKLKDGKNFGLLEPEA